MNREHIKWYSNHLGRDMEMLRFGHAGTPILAFPSSLGRFFEWEDFGMVKALDKQLSNGHNQLFCVDSVDAESLYNKDVDPYTRIKRHQQYEGYIANEVLPHIHNTAGQQFTIAAGASFGAYHATNMVLKRPWDFGKLIALSGIFDIKSQLDGFYNDDVYFSNPIDFLPNLSDENTLHAIRQNHIILNTAEHDPCKDANLHMSHVLNTKGINHTLDLRDGVFGHDWDWWCQFIQQHIA
ncbi:MAG: alpha/beta hydrolase-fold protein [Bacteroidota bacterium]